MSVVVCVRVRSAHARVCVEVVWSCDVSGGV